MNDIEIFEQDLISSSTNQIVGKIAIIRGGLDNSQPQVMNQIVEKYVGNNAYSQFIEMNNQWQRVIISGINELDFRPFENQTL